MEDLNKEDSPFKFQQHIIDLAKHITDLIYYLPRPVKYIYAGSLEKHSDMMLEYVLNFNRAKTPQEQLKCLYVIDNHTACIRIKLNILEDKGYFKNMKDLVQKIRKDLVNVGSVNNKLQKRRGAYKNENNTKNIRG